MVPIETRVCHVATCMAIVQNIYKHELEHHSESLPAEVVTLLKINSIAKEKEIFSKKRKIQNNIRTNYFEKRKRSPSPVAPRAKFGEKHLKQLQHKLTSPIPARKSELHIPNKKNSILTQLYRTVNEPKTSTPERETVTAPKVATLGEVTNEPNIKVETTSSDEQEYLKGNLNVGHDSRSNDSGKCSMSKKRNERKMSKTTKKELHDLKSLSPNNDRKSSLKINKSTSTGLQIKKENVDLEEPTINSNTIELPEKVKKKKKVNSSSKNKKEMQPKAKKLKGNSIVEELRNELLSLHEEQNNHVTSSTAGTHEISTMEVPEISDMKVSAMEVPVIPGMTSESETPGMTSESETPGMTSESETPGMTSESEIHTISKKVKSEKSEAENSLTTTAISLKEEEEIAIISPVLFDIEEPPEIKYETVEDSDEDIIFMEDVKVLKTKNHYKTEVTTGETLNHDNLITDFILSENIVAALSQCRQNSSPQISLSTCQIIRQIILVILYLKVLNLETLIKMRVCDFMCPKHLGGYVLIEPSVESLSDFKPIKLLKSQYKYIRNFIVTIRPKLSSDPYGLLFTGNEQNSLTAEEAKKIILMCWTQSELTFNISQLF